MEVHHHPHAPHGEKKTFKEYFLEFLMIFLAVTMGFLSESIREHFHERRQEKEYISSLVGDLRSDTAKINHYIPVLRSAYMGLDTLVTQCYLPSNKMDTRKMYYSYHHYCRQWYDLKLYDKTLVQLKSSGNMRLISGKAVDSLALLDDRMEYFNDRLAYFLASQSQAIEEGLNFFDYAAYTKANTDSTGNLDIMGEQGFLTLSYRPSLLKYDPASLRHFAGNIGLFRNQTLLMIQLMRGKISELTESITFFKDTYHLNE